MDNAEAERTLRVIVCPVTRRDGEVTLDLLARAGVACEVVFDLAAIAAEISQDIGAVMLTDVVLSSDSLARLADALRAQPSWSAVPVLVMIREHLQSAGALRALAELGNVTLLDRPLSTRAMTSAVLAALRDRRRQYRIRAQIVRQELIEQQLKEANRRKDEFLATLAHELRNPLAPIRTGLQLLGKLPGETARAADVRGMMERQMRQMVRLIDELLEVSRIATGKIVLKREHVDLRGIVDHALEASRPMLDAAGHAVEVTSPRLPVWVDADPSRVSQVIGNLLNNAAKYTPNGGRIEVRVSEDGECGQVSVTDNGIGLPEDKLEEIFEMFTQVGRSLARSQGGLGIGLSLVRNLMALHGGSVTAWSPGQDQGCTFTVRLPSLPARAGRPVETDGTPAPSPMQARRVLIIDDNQDAAHALAALAIEDGHVARTETSSIAGMAAVHEFHPEVIICDIGMPNMDGYQLARRLRADPALQGVLLVALTGWGGEEDVRRALEAGFDRHLTKPIGYDDFARIFDAAQRAAPV
jgi:signal transduction histidine kinase/ActR/RegA family two-component response regulator